MARDDKIQVAGVWNIFIVVESIFKQLIAEISTQRLQQSNNSTYQRRGAGRQARGVLSCVFRAETNGSRDSTTFPIANAFPSHQYLELQKLNKICDF